MDKNTYNIVIIGSGPAGLTAAIYTARAELSPLLLGGKMPGGQLMYTTEVENYPGFPEGIQGPELMEKMIKQAERFGAKLIYTDVTEVDLKNKPFTIKTETETYKAKTVIISTGADARKLGLSSEDKLLGKGVSTCATCDAAFFKDKKVYIVGGGDSAMEEATFLTKFANFVTVIHRRDTLNASKIMQERAKSNKKIDFLWNTEILEVLGEDKMTGLRVKNTKTGEENELKGDGMFLAIGRIPNTQIFKGQIKMGERGFIEVTNHTHSSVEGVFIAGDVSDYRYRQAVTSAGAGCMAAIDAERYLAGQE